MASSFRQWMAVAVSLEFREPPGRKRNRLFNDDTVAELRANPGRWAVIREYTYERRTTNVIKRPTDIELRIVFEPPGSVLYARARTNGK